MEISFQGLYPELHPDVFVAPQAIIVGGVKAGSGCSFWFNAVARADNDAIVIGERTNIQEQCVLHVDAGLPMQIGDDCVIGHAAVLHGCTVGNRVLVGIGARVLNRAVIEDEVVVGAGSLVPEGAHLESGHLYLGVPARKIRALRPDEVERIHRGASHYVEIARDYRVTLKG
jgi:carbonic anhydrase/acetyltransferase-like protein (isoleucine patch superfamily)